MNVAEVLSTHFEGVAPLNRPIMVLALRGWFDIAEVATVAINELLADRVAPIVASIDPDPFFDFTQERPLVELDEDEIRHIHWPLNEFRFARFPGQPPRSRGAGRGRAAPALHDVRRLRARGGQAGRSARLSSRSAPSPTPSPTLGPRSSSAALPIAT